jgi:hypothetical protein
MYIKKMALEIERHFFYIMYETITILDFELGWY